MKYKWLPPRKYPGGGYYVFRESVGAKTNIGTQWHFKTLQAARAFYESMKRIENRKLKKAPKRKTPKRKLKKAPKRKAPKRKTPKRKTPKRKPKKVSRRKAK